MVTSFEDEHLFEAPQKRRRPLNLEHYEQVKFFETLKILQAQGNNEAFLPFAVPNAALRTGYQGLWMKAEGLQAGVPDIIIPAARRGYTGLAIELKIKPNKMTDEQAKWMNRLIAERWIHHLAYSAVEAWQAFCWYFDKPDWLYMLQ